MFSILWKLFMDLYVYSYFDGLETWVTDEMIVTRWDSGKKV